MFQQRTRRSKLATVLVATLAGGSLLSTCSGRVKDGVVQGSKDFLFSLLDPTSLADLILDSVDPEETSTEAP